VDSKSTEEGCASDTGGEMPYCLDLALPLVEENNDMVLHAHRETVNTTRTLPLWAVISCE